MYQKYILPRMIDLAMNNRDIAAVRARVVPEATGRVLEIGIGSGLNLPFYGPGAESVTGVDPSGGLAKIAAPRVAKARLPVEFVRQSGEEIPFDKATFDTIVVTWTLCSIPDAGAALTEMRRVLKPGGRLLFVEHGLAPDAGVARWQNRFNPVWRPFAGGCNLNRKIDDLISNAGFRIDGLETFYMPGPKVLTYNYLGAARPA